LRRPLLHVFVVLAFALLFVFVVSKEMRDFEVNYRAGERLRAGVSLYQTSDGHYMFKYFPSSALLYAPFSLLPLGAAKALWYALTAASTFGLFLLSKRLVFGGAPAPWPLLAVAPLVLAKFLAVEIKLGQINVLVSLVLVGTLLVRSEGRAGTLWGLATAMKPYGLIFLPYYLILGRWAALGAGLAVLAGALLLPAVFYGFEGNVELHREWYGTLSASTPRELASADNVSLAAFVAKWSLPVWAALASVLGLAALMLLILRSRRAIPRPEVLEVATLLALIPIVSPLGWDYQFVTAALALTLLARRWADFPTTLRVLLALDLAVIGLSLYDLMGRASYRSFMEWSILTPCFVLIVLFLLYLRYYELN
jgi:alpha-1,2-mannosyltransferase